MQQGFSVLFLSESFCLIHFRDCVSCSPASFVACSVVVVVVVLVPGY